MYTISFFWNVYRCKPLQGPTGAIIFHNMIFQHLILKHGCVLFSCILPHLKKRVTSISVGEIDSYGAPELPSVYPDIAFLVKSLSKIQQSICPGGRFHLFLELGKSNQDSRRQHFYGHADIVMLFLPTVEIGVGNADIYAMYLASALAEFLMTSTQSPKTNTSTAAPKNLENPSTMCAHSLTTPLHNSTSSIAPLHTNVIRYDSSTSSTPISSIVLQKWFLSSSYPFSTETNSHQMIIDKNNLGMWER